MIHKIVADLIASEIVKGFDPDETCERYVKIQVAKFLATALETGTLTVVLPTNPYTFAGITVELSDPEFAAVIAFIKARRKIAAIKTVRDATRIGLREAKDFVTGFETILTMAQKTENAIYLYHS